MVSNALRKMLADVEELEREAASAARIGRDNDALCDEIAAAGARIRKLEAALELLIDGITTNSQAHARAVLMGVDDEELSVLTIDEMWTEREKARSAA